MVITLCRPAQAVRDQLHPSPRLQHLCQHRARVPVGRHPARHRAPLVNPEMLISAPALYTCARTNADLPLKGHPHIHIYIYIGGWGGETNREIVSFRVFLSSRRTRLLVEQEDMPSCSARGHVPMLSKRTCEDMSSC